MNCIAQLRHVDMKILRSTSPRPATVSLLYVDHSFGCCIYLIPKQKIHGSLLTGRFSQGQGRFGQNWRSSVPIHHAKLTRVFLAVSSPATRSLAVFPAPFITDRDLSPERERERERENSPAGEGEEQEGRGNYVAGRGTRAAAARALPRRRRGGGAPPPQAGARRRGRADGAGAGGADPARGEAARRRPAVNIQVRSSAPPPSSRLGFLLLRLFALTADCRDDKNEIILFFFFCFL
jgi:hypothetical protein